MMRRYEEKIKAKKKLKQNKLRRKYESRAFRS